MPDSRTLEDHVDGAARIPEELEAGPVVGVDVVQQLPGPRASWGPRGARPWPGLPAGLSGLFRFFSLVPFAYSSSRRGGRAGIDHELGGGPRHLPGAVRAGRRVSWDEPRNSERSGSWNFLMQQQWRADGRVADRADHPGARNGLRGRDALPARILDGPDANGRPFTS